MTATAFSSNPSYAGILESSQLHPRSSGTSFIRRFIRKPCPGNRKSSPGRSPCKPRLHGADGPSATRGQGPHQAQFPLVGIANASASLPYKWVDSSRQPVSRLLDEIYGPVMESVTLKAAIADALAISDHKSQEVVTARSASPPSRITSSPSTTASPRRHSRPATGVI